MGKKKNKKEKVEVGTTVEMNVDSNEVNEVKNPKNEKMGKKSKKDAKGANVELIAAIVDKNGKKADLHKIVKENKLFSKKENELLVIKSIFSLRKEMLDYFDTDQVAEIKAAMPKPEKKAKPKVVEAESVSAEDEKLTKKIADATKEKQLKKIAKSDERFDWKKLKGLELDEMVVLMLSLLAPKPAKKEPAKPKMIANPQYEEFKAITKFKKLVKWVKANEIELPKKLKKYDQEELENELDALIPAEIEAPKGSGKGSQKGETRPGICSMIRDLVEKADPEEGISKTEIHDELVEAFPDRDADSMKRTVATQVPGRIHREKFHVTKLANGNFCKEVEATEKPKDKKKKKDKKKNKKNK